MPIQETALDVVPPPLHSNDLLEKEDKRRRSIVSIDVNEAHGVNVQHRAAVDEIADWRILRVLFVNRIPIEIFHTEIINIERRKPNKAFLGNSHTDAQVLRVCRQV
ncbi:unnamed protein product [Toxocara canis]|uniref:Uncharacterized protein n=1 Tax=Toxocara canis TaxID=6265 RepID=A0A183ULZ5_TOXCA|nr:unnamed protein product [Toxocara canis]